MSDGSVTIDTSLDNDGLKKGIGNIENSFDKLKNVAIKAISAIGFGSLIKEGVQYNATVEQLQTSFEVMTGSATKAANIVEKLKQIGASTPFEFTGLAETTQLLMNYGLEADDAIDKMQMLGDISQGSADKMNRIAMAYGQMSSAGKVSLEDIKQMIEAGFNPLQEISESTGESMASLYKRISKGTISIDEITASMERSTAAGGKYFQSMEKQSQTLNGQWSTVQDNFSNLLGSILQPISEMLTNNILPAVNDFMSKLQEKIDNGGLDSFLNTLKGILAVIVPLTTAVITFKAAMAIKGIIDSVKTSFAALNAVMKANPILLIVSLIAGLVSGIIYLWNTNEGFRDAIISIWENIKKAVENVVNSVVSFFTETIPNAWNSFVTGLQSIAQSIWDTLVNTWNSIVSFFTETIPSWIQSVITWFQELPYNIGVLIGTAIGHIIKFGQDMWNWVTTELPKIIQGIIDWFAKLPENIWNWLVQAATNVFNWGKDITEKATTAVSTMFNNVINWFQQLPGEIWNWLTQTVTNIYNWGIDMKNKAVEGMTNMVNSIIDTVKNLPSKMLEIGKNIVQGIWNGISGAVGWLWDKITGFCNGIVDGIKSVFGIHSPSKLFADEVGKMLGLGLGEGFDDSLASVYKDMQKAVEHENAKLTNNLTNTQQIKVQNEDNRQATLESIDNNKEIVVNSTLNLDGKKVANNTKKVFDKQKLQYGYA